MRVFCLSDSEDAASNLCFNCWRLTGSTRTTLVASVRLVIAPDFVARSSTLTSDEALKFWTSLSCCRPPFEKASATRFRSWQTLRTRSGERLATVKILIVLALRSCIDMRRSSIICVNIYNRDTR